MLEMKNNTQELYTALNGVEYSALDADTKTVLLQSFILVTGDETVEEPLTEAGFNYIKDAMATAMATEELINNANMSKEDKTMRNEFKNVVKNAKVTVRGAKRSMVNAAKNLKVQTGSTAQEFVNESQDELNTITATFTGMLDVVSSVVGYDNIKNDILGIMAAGLDETSGKHDLFRMAKKCRETIQDEINFLEECADEESLKDAAAWKVLLEDEDGNDAGEYSKSIFEVLVTSVMWVKKKVARKLRKWFNVDDEKSLLGSICRALGILGDVLRAGVKVVHSGVKFVFSFVAAAVIKAVNFLVNCIKVVVAKIKGFFNKDNLEEDDFEEDDFEYDFFAEEEGVEA